MLGPTQRYMVRAGTLGFAPASRRTVVLARFDIRVVTKDNDYKMWLFRRSRNLL